MSKTTLLTGGGGFLGTHLRTGLPDRQVLAPTSRELDLRDLRAVEAYLDAQGVQEIVHAAAYVGGIAFHRAHPSRMIADNLTMGVNLLNAAAARGIPTLIVSSACVYPDDAPIPTPETALYNGYPTEATAYYGIAKRTLHTMAEALNKEHGWPYSIVVPINMYGPHDHFDEERSHVVGALIRRCVQAKRTQAPEMVVWGDGSQTRDFLFIDDAVAGVVAALGEAGRNDTFNLGSGRETSIRELAETIREVVGYEGRLVFDATKPSGSLRRALDIRKTTERLGFTPGVALRDGLARTVEWYEANFPA